MKLIKEMFPSIIIIICVMTYCMLALPDPEIELWLKILTGVPVFGALIGYIIWLIKSFRNSD